MTEQRDLNRILDAFLLEGTNEVADRVIEAALEDIDRTQQRHALRVPRRFSTMKSSGRLAAAAAIGVLAVASALYIARPNQPVIGGPSPSPDRSIGASPHASPSPSPSSSPAPRAASWTSTSKMTVARYFHTATLLPDGKVLVAGGWTGPDTAKALASAELYDPETGSWTATGDMTTAREAHTATLLRDGRVLVVGGYGNADFHALASAELYDPTTGAWTATPAMPGWHGYHTATLLSDGRVLVAAGRTNNSSTGIPLGTADVYDPVTDSWSATGSMLKGRPYDAAVLLPDGRVLMAGVSYRSYLADTDANAELYDPATGSWSAAGRMRAPGNNHTATLLSDGTVLVAGGGGRKGILASAERYDPVGGIWTATGRLQQARVFQTATLLQDGRVLATGGEGVAGFDGGEGPPDATGIGMASAELYDLRTGSWIDAPSMTVGRELHTATLLRDGRVLVTGGGRKGNPLDSAELYDPGSGT